MFRGAITALVTPFKNGKIDTEALEKHIRWQIQEGIDGLLPCGTTGETPALEDSEKELVVKTAVKLAKESGKKLPVIAGAGTNSTSKTVKEVMEVKEWGADAALVVTPYYNKPTQDGLYGHFSEVCEKTDMPVVIYNIPGRTGVNMTPATFEKVCRRYDKIVAVKEASGNLDQVSEIVSRCGWLSVLSGDDSLTLPILSVGGKGVISVVSNIAPKDTATLVRLFEERKIDEARDMHHRLFKLIKALFTETNPGPIKTATGILKWNTGEVRLPMSGLSEENLSKLKTALKEYGLVK
ncbi:4-hydroxy-tetrahydrodipicolinate synthase [bacterium]|nr:4-hydroxy-tetrahydrodipicolinate synthase [bacterium]